VHTPEFAFEHVPSNVRSAVKRLGVRYPVAIDNQYGTWNDYGNQYWPAEYLIDRNGHLRRAHFGEATTTAARRRSAPCSARSRRRLLRTGSATSHRRAC